MEYIENGGSITEAAKIYRIGRATIYRWMNRKDLQATKVTSRYRKIDKEVLKKDVQENPEMTIKERAMKFGVTPGAISYMFKKLKITRKNNRYVLKK